MNHAREQYSLVQSSRTVLLDYCEAVSTKHFLEPLDVFSGKSMRDLLFHVAETYLFWVGEFGLKRPQDWEKPKPSNVSGLREKFSEVDSLVEELMQTYGNSWESPIKGSANAREIIVPAFELFSHVITHEFHHKGQILTMSRLLGYKPVDTDIIRS